MGILIFFARKSLQTAIPLFQIVQPVRNRHCQPDADGRLRRQEIEYKCDTIGRQVDRYPDQVSCQEPEEDKSGGFALFNCLVNHIADGRDYQDLY